MTELPASRGSPGLTITVTTMRSRPVVLIRRATLVGVDRVAAPGVLFRLAGGLLLERGLGRVLAELVAQAIGELGVAVDALAEPVLDPTVGAGIGLLGIIARGHGGPPRSVRGLPR